MYGKYTYTTSKVKRAGKRDGRAWRGAIWPPQWPFWEAKEPIPPIDQEEPTEYEKELVKAADGIIREVADEWEKMDRKLKEEYCNSKKELINAKKALEKEKGEHKEAIGEYEMAREKFYKIPLPHLSRKIYLPLMIGIVAGEFPINALVFAIFGQGKIETYIIAALLCLAIPGMAHLSGKSIKQTHKNWYWIGIANFSVLAALVGISVLREKFFEAAATQELLGIALNPTDITIIIITINLLIFVLATWLAYEAGHTDPDAFIMAKRVFDEAASNLEKESGELMNAEKRFEDAQRKFIKAQSVREQEFERKMHQVEKTKDSFERFIFVYRRANLDKRKDKSLPASFKKNHEFEIPAELQNLSWECPELEEDDVT